MDNAVRFRGCYRHTFTKTRMRIWEVAQQSIVKFQVPSRRVTPLEIFRTTHKTTAGAVLMVAEQTALVWRSVSNFLSVVAFVGVAHIKSMSGNRNVSAPLRACLTGTRSRRLIFGSTSSAPLRSVLSLRASFEPVFCCAFSRRVCRARAGQAGQLISYVFAYTTTYICLRARPLLRR